MYDIIFLILVFFTGMCLGSFLDVCVYRIPIGKNVVTGRSYCTNCNTYLKPLDLVPLFSFLFLKGRCRYCKTKLSWEYPLSELTMGLLFLLTYFRFGINPYLWALTVFIVSVNVVIAKIDWDTTFIPNSVSYPSIVIAAILSFFIQNLPLEGLVPQPTTLEAWIGGIAYFGLFLLLFFISNGGMGMGDAKWALFMGLFLGWRYAFVALFIASLLSVIFSGFVLIFFRKKIKNLPNNKISSKDDDELPINQKVLGISIVNGKPAIVLGPFLAIGTLITWFFGVSLLGLYL